MEQSPSWEANQFAASQEIPCISWNRKVHYCIHSVRHLSLSWASSIQSVPPHPTSWRSILISSPLHHVLPSGLFPSGFTTKTLYMLLVSPIYVLYIQYRVIQNNCRGFNNLPPCSPDATPCDFFIWGYVKDQVYVPPLPASIPELKVWIGTAIETITADMPETVWNELDYRVDVCRITKDAHVEHL